MARREVRGVPTFRASVARVNWSLAPGLIVLLGSALVLRLWGIAWGLPNSVHYYPFHPDEAVVLSALCSVNPLWGDFTPGFYNYGSGYILLVRSLFDSLVPILGWGTAPGDAHRFTEWLPDLARLLLTGRVVSALLGVAAVWLVWWIGRRNYGSLTGWMAGAALAVAPMPVVLSHYATVDTAAVTWALGSLFLTLHLLEAPAGRSLLWTALGAGAAAGLAAGSKYNLGLVILLVPLGLLLRPEAAAVPLGRVGAFTAAAWSAGAALFLLSTPGALLQPELFQRHFAYEMSLSREGMGLLFEGLPPPLFYHLGVSLPVALEWPLYGISLVGAAAALRRRRPADIILLAYLGLNLLLIAISERSYVRYALPLLPALVVLGAAAVVRGETGAAHRAWSAAVVAAMAGALLSSIAHVGALSAPDSRILADSYLRTEARGALVALAGDPWYYTPPVHPSAGSVKAATLLGGPPVWELTGAPEGRPRLFQLERFRLLVPPVNGGALGTEALLRHRPDWVVISDYEYEDPLRLKRLRPGYEDETTRMLAYLEDEYELAREIRPRPALGPLTWWSRGIPPHDWRYFMPTIRLYRRR